MSSISKLLIGAMLGTNCLQLSFGDGDNTGVSEWATFFLNAITERRKNEPAEGMTKGFNRT